MSEIQFDTTASFRIQALRELGYLEYDYKSSSYRQSKTMIEHAFKRMWQSIPDKFPDQKQDARCELLDAYKSLKAKDAAMPDLDKKYQCYLDVRQAFKKYLLENYEGEIGTPGELDPEEIDTFFTNEIASITKSYLTHYRRASYYSHDPQQSSLSSSDAVAQFKTMDPLWQQRIFMMWLPEANDEPVLNAMTFKDFIAVTHLHEQTIESDSTTEAPPKLITE